MPVPLTEKEEEIRVARGDLRDRAARVRRVDPARGQDRVSRRRNRQEPDDDRADRLGAPRRQGRSRSCRARRFGSTPTCCRPRTARRRFRSTPSIRSPAATPSIRARSRSPTTTSSSPERKSDDRQTSIGREFAGRMKIEHPYYATPGDGIFHFYFPGAGPHRAGRFYPGADSHSRAYGAYGAVGIGVGSDDARLWLVDRVHLLHAGQAAARRSVPVRCSRGSAARTSCSRLLHKWGAKQSQGMSVEFVDANGSLPIPYRNTIANMMAEGEAQNGIFAQDEITTAGSRSAASHCPTRTYRPAPNATYAIDEELSLSELVPMIAKPFSPRQRVCRRGGRRREDHLRQGVHRLVHERQLQTTCCTPRSSSAPRAPRASTRSPRAPSSSSSPAAAPCSRTSRSPTHALDGESIADVFRSVGGAIRESWCGPCFGQGPDALREGQRAITTFNRNWQNRMGVGGEGYLASPAVVAASALAGYMAPPTELGVDWDSEKFAI